MSYILRVYKDNSKRKETRWTLFAIPKADTAKKIVNLKKAVADRGFFVKKRIVGASSEGYAKPSAARTNATKVLNLGERFDVIVYDETRKNPAIFVPLNVDTVHQALDHGNTRRCSNG